MTKHYLRTVISASLFLTIAIATSSCNTAKKASSSDVGNYSTASRSATEGLTTANLSATFRTTMEQYKEWSRISAPLTIRLSEPNKVQLSVTVTMERGRSILMSLRMIGLEVATLYADSDSVTFIDKYDKRYLSMPLANVFGQSGLSIADIQDMLLGRPFALTHEGPVTSQSLPLFDIEAYGSDAWLMIPRQQPSQAEYGFRFCPPTQLQAIMLKPNDKPLASVTYSQSTSTPIGPVAAETELSVTLNGKPIHGTLVWNLGSLKLDSQVTLRRPTVSSKYSRIQITDLLKIMK